MSADLAARLRALARDHQTGKLSLAVYRKLRAPLLDSLALHAVRGPDEKTQPRALARTPEAAPAHPASQQPSSAARAKPYAQIAIALFALTAIAGLAFWTLHRPAPNDAVTADSDSPEGAVYELVGAFNERGDWSEARIAALNAALLELDRQQIAGAATQQWFQRFVDELRKRFKEQQALAPAPLTARTSPLAALAVTVGLDLNSPDAGIRIAPPEEVSSVASAGAQTNPSADEKPARAASSQRRSQPRDQSRAQPDEARVDGARPDAPVKKTEAAVAAVAPVRASAAPDRDTGAVQREEACRAELVRSRRPYCHDTLAFGEDGPELALIPAGAFDMGSTRAAVEQPIHRVTIPKPFAMSVYEVSQAEFRLYCTQTRRSCAAQPWSGDDYPAVNVSWREAREYAEWLSKMTGQRYRLPSESQWEYAARAGERGLVPGGDVLSPTDAHYSMLAALSTPARRSQRFNHNAFRLLHTLGNVREWVEDAWVESFAAAPDDGSPIRSASSGLRVARGGSYADNAATLRLSMRESLPAETRDVFTGFRVVRELP